MTYDDMSSNSISLKVSTAYNADIGRNRIRMSLENMKKTGVSKGDIIEIKGKKRSVCSCFPLYSSERKREIIRMDSLTRSNCGAKENDSVTIKKISAKIAKQITLKELDEPGPPIDERYFNDALDGVSFTKADNVMVPYFGGRLTYQIVKTVPTGAIIISKATEFVILDSTKLIKKKIMDSAKTQSLKTSKELQNKTKLSNRNFDPHKHHRRMSLESVKELTELQKQIEKQSQK